MSEKLYLLITFVLVLTLSGVVRAEPNDANLIGWWKFDEAEGNTVEDSSGHGNHGVTNDPNPKWTVGYPGDPCDSAMDFDGDGDGEAGFGDYVVCAKRDGNGPGEYPEELMPEKFTIACWTRLDNFTYYGGFVSNGFEDERCGFFLNNGGNDWNFGISMMTNDWWDVETPTPIKYLTDRWHHLAATYDGQTAIVYVNGEVGVREDGIGGPIKWRTDDGDGNYPSNFVIGTWIDEGYGYEYGGLPVDGIIDDVRFYNYAMDLNDIRILAGIVPGAACNPSPAYGQRNASMFADLSWTPGSDWARHDVYFGTDKDAVKDANTVVQLGVYVRQQDANFVSNSELDPALELTKEYFWRVDEVNLDDGTIIKGTVWNFKVANYIIIDDMESYTSSGSTAIYNKWYSDWITSTATISLQTEGGGIDYVHGEEGQSMSYEFRNSTSPYYAEAVRELSSADVTDWTVGDVKALVLYFRDDKANPPDAVQPMYFSVSDGSDTATVEYHDPNDLIRYRDGWQEWNIDLQDFIDDGIDLENITEMSIKIGDGNEAGDGYVYFDDIRLYLVRCVPEISYAYGDLTGEDWWTGDCNVDALDLEWMTYDWLASDYNVMVSVPNDANLVGWWKFDEGSGDTVEDSSIYSNDGSTDNPSPDWETGYTGEPDDYAMWFDGLNPYYLTCALRDGNNLGSYPAELMPDTFTIALWTKLWTFSDYAAFVTNGIDGGCGFYLYNTARGEAPDVEGTFNLAMRTEPGWQDVQPPDIYETDTWYHIAVTYDGNYANFYVDGVLEAGPQNVEGPMKWIDKDSNSYPSHFIIGAWEDQWWSEDIHGLIDEVRYYDYALPHGEVAYLAGLEGEQYVPLEAYANIVPRIPDPAVEKQFYPLNPDVVNFTDFAVLADNWLNNILFP